MNRSWQLTPQQPAQPSQPQQQGGFRQIATALLSDKQWLMSLLQALIQLAQSQGSQQPSRPGGMPGGPMPGGGM